ncbi:MAG: GNAT family N-acetyltransferase [Cytophagales bacterium]|nr:MAG: GNAT family N-acetyltransferase [Cytophagales bacterium]TAF59951.1 MAG: GNAT family N-acetyltransferase [Cytophagales bacterium]
MEIQVATTADIDKLIPTLLELRTHLTPTRLRHLLPVLFAEGYKIVFVGDDKLAFSIAGYRCLNFLFSGKTLYIDDLITHSGHRRKGYGQLLLTHLKKVAKEEGYDQISLDSGFQRKDAHRLYLNSGLEIASLHFARETSLL